MNILPSVLAVLCGVMLTIQVGMNSTLGRSLDSPFMAAGINLALAVVLTTFTVVLLARPWPSAATLQDVPWWAWFGGVLGAAYLTGNIQLAPTLGAATLVGCIVTGQLLFAVLADHFGWLGFEQHSAHSARIAGCALIVGGALLIAKY